MIRCASLARAAGVLLSLVLYSCGGAGTPGALNEEAKLLSGTWNLTFRKTLDREEPATSRLLKLTLRDDSTFQALYRGDLTQEWIVAGQGAFSCSASLLRLFWDSGQQTTLLVRERSPDRLVLRHGYNLVPLREQEPDEVFTGDTNGRNNPATRHGPRR
ncbi:MAG: hypothetical protein FJ118_03425 [Deltaproteobacteria bacterium]|nr:hypothetical protein [Deltaproteobacteria bacterium]